MFTMQDAENIKSIAAIAVGTTLLAYAVYRFYPIVTQLAQMAGL